MRFIFILLLIINCLSTGFAQQEQSKTQPDYILKFTPTATFNVITPGVQFGLEQRLVEGKSMQYEVGILSHRLGLSYTDGNMFGYRLRAEYRKYRNNFEGTNKFGGWILEGKQRFLEDEFMLQHPELAFTERYNERLILTRVTTSASVYYTRGVQYFYENNFTVEIAAGIGARYLRSAALNIPDGINTENLRDQDHYEIDINNSSVLPVGFLCLRIGYILR